MEEYVKFAATGVLSGTTFVALVKGVGYLIKQKREISPQPLEIKHTKDNLSLEEFYRHADQNEKEHSKIYERLESAERHNAKLDGTLTQINDRLKSNDDKLTVILQKIRKG